MSIAAHVALDKIENKMANSFDPDEMARYEPSHLDLHCLQRYICWFTTRLKGSRVLIRQYGRTGLAGTPPPPLVITTRHVLIVLLCSPNIVKNDDTKVKRAL